MELFIIGMLNDLLKIKIMNSLEMTKQVHITLEIQFIHNVYVYIYNVFVAISCKLS